MEQIKMSIPIWLALLFKLFSSSGLEISGETTVTEGDTLNLTCRFDGFPEFLLIWTKLGVNASIINAPRTATLLINIVTGDDSGQYMCTAQHQNTTLTEDVDVTVKYVKTPTITGESTIKEDGSLNLTCTVNSFPPSVIMWSKHGINKTLSSENGTGTLTLVIHNVTEEHSGQYFCSASYLNKTLEQDRNDTGISEKKLRIFGETTVKAGDALNLTCTKYNFPSSIVTWTKNGLNKARMDVTSDNSSSTIVVHNTTAEDSGQYVCTAKHLNNTLTEKVDVSVISAWNMNITGESTVREGETLNLTCTVEGFHSSVITWTKSGMNKSFNNETRSEVLRSTLIIPNVTTTDSGQYICTARSRTTHIQDINITVILLPKILEESGCEAQLEVLTCLCISQGFPSPTITWEQLGNQMEYSVNTAVSNHTVKSTLTLNVKYHASISAVCVSRNRNGNTSRNLKISRVEDEGPIRKLLRNITQMGTVIPFVIGVLLSGFIFCFLLLCCRKKKNSYGSTSETLEMVMTKENEDYESFQGRETAGGADGPEAGTSDVDYSDINVLLLKQQLSSPVEQKPKNPDTDYATIRPKGAGMAGNEEVVEEEEEEGNEEEEVKLCEPEDAEGEAAAVYSNVTKLKDHR